MPDYKPWYVHFKNSFILLLPINADWKHSNMPGDTLDNLASN